MAEPDDMVPVTRGELREELAAFEAKLDDKLERLEHRLEHRLEERLDQKLARFADREEIDRKFEIFTGAILARIDEVAAESRRMEARLMGELARHTRSMEENLRSQIVAVDDKYASLPARVDKLEHAVFTPPPRRRRSRG